MPHCRMSYANFSVVVAGVMVPLVLSGLLWHQIYQRDADTESPDCLIDQNESCRIVNSPRVLVREALVTVSDMTNAWEPRYQGGQRYDTAHAVSGATTLAIDTDTSVEWFGAGLTFPTEDWSGSDFRFFVRTDNWEALSIALLLVETGSLDDEAYFTFNLLNFFSAPASNEWREVVIPKSAFEASFGRPDWRAVRGISFRVSSKQNQHATLWVDDFSRYNSAQNGLVSLTFDDGFADTLVGAELMSGFGFLGTNYVIPTHLGAEGFLTQEEVDLLHELGWDISGHGYYDLRELGYEEAQRDLAHVAAYLDRHGYRGKHLYSYPNGSYDHEIQNLVRSFFLASRTIDGFTQPQGYLNLTALNGVTVSNTTRVEEIIEHIDQAHKEGSWLILTWHKLTVDEPIDDIEYARDDFLLVLEHLAQNNITVVRVSDVLVHFMNPSS
jgi:peptidoglycan/xylan/chitin deacetylase (PgdA/CDA1 family)